MQSVNQPVKQSINQSISQSCSQSINQCHAVSQLISQSFNQSCIQSVNHSLCQSFRQAISQSNSPPITQSVSQAGKCHEPYVHPSWQCSALDYIYVTKVFFFLCNNNHRGNRLVKVSFGMYCQITTATLQDVLKPTEKCLHSLLY